jgi:hypothetical protein
MFERIKSIKKQTGVSQDVIDSLGGIEDTIKPLERSLLTHELRPYDYEPTDVAL